MFSRQRQLPILPLLGALAAPLCAGPLLIQSDLPPVGKGIKPGVVAVGDARQYPSKQWESQGQPLGNGRIGAMVFGNPLRERIQFNESSLWTGGDNPSGGYDIREFGAYQNFGDIDLELAGGADDAPAAPVCASGHTPFVASEDVDAAGDGDAATKWCVEHHGKPVVWQVDFGRAAPLAKYAMISANDVPARDPQAWVLEGSNDGKTWQELHRVEDGKPFDARGGEQTYTLAAAAACRHYRMTFSPTPVEHFQVAEIRLGDASPQAANIEVIDNYTRTLDLATATHLTRWRHQGVSYTREVLVSKPDDIVAIRIASETPGKSVGGKVRLLGAHQESTVAEGAALAFHGSLTNGLRQAARLVVLPGDKGSVTAEGDALVFSGERVTLLLAAATDYAMDPARSFRSGKDPAATVKATLAAAARKRYEDIRAQHLADFATLMGRVALEVGAPPEDLCVQRRLEAYKKGGKDPHLEALMFHFGRYLLISSSRGALPANLQGLWNDSNKPAWNSDYHTNINLQMCYWLAEPANLSECALPLFRWTEAMIPGSRAATVKAFGAGTAGWTMRTSVNIFGGNGWDWNIPASAWLAQHFMEHYAFTGDKDFLRASAWPVLRDVSLYWLGHLVEKDGKLLVPQGWSPEHGPREDGVAHDQQLVWDLFTNTLTAAKAMKIDDEFTRKVAAAREKLLGPQVGSWGQLMEWTTERPPLEKSNHRHTSHLFAVYPGNQINLRQTPEWAKAAMVSLDARGSTGDSRRSWTWPWRTALWARFEQPERAGEMIRGLLTHNTLPNLFATHPPFQIDGNLGITAGICETLLQSHAGELQLLPALPPSWAGAGRCNGLKARGGFAVDMAWSAGRLQRADVTSEQGKPLALRWPGNPATLAVKAGNGAETKLKAGSAGTFSLPTKAGMRYHFRPAP